MHIVAHLFNFEYFMDAQLIGDSRQLASVLSAIGDNASFLNPIRSNDTVRGRGLHRGGRGAVTQICEIPPASLPHWRTERLLHDELPLRRTFLFSNETQRKKTKMCVCVSVSPCRTRPW